MLMKPTVSEPWEIMEKVFIYKWKNRINFTCLWWVGVCEYYNCDPNDVDILMGTFTKSFAAAGGYIAGRREIISFLRFKSANFYYATSMSPPIIQQITSVINSLMDKKSDVHQRIKRLQDNTKYFRKQLTRLGFHINGHDDSPVVPIMVYSLPNIKYIHINILLLSIMKQLMGNKLY